MVPRSLIGRKTTASSGRFFAKSWELHPATLTQDELVRELNGGRPRQFCEVDRVERAIRELAGTGLLHRPGEEEMIQPTRSALRYFELSGEAT
jgi:hypothetical protein